MASPSPESALHGWRSRAIDAFALAEANIDGLLRKLGLAASGDQLSSKIDKLRKAKATSTYSEARKKHIDEILIQLQAVIGIRNDIVHSPMVIRQEGEHALACFANPNQKCEFSSVRREISAPRLQALAVKVNHLAKALEAA